MQTSSKAVEQITMAAASDIGTLRDENEDFYFFSNSKKFFIVCDGMGGHEKGALASKIAGATLRDLIFASETLRDIVIEKSFLDVSRICQDIDKKLPIQALKLISGIRLANRRILSYSRYTPKMKEMGTTVAAAVVQQGRIFIAHVGDSRVYRLRHGKLSCLTTDHSWLNELLEDKDITQKEAVRFREKNVLTRALGAAAAIKVDLQIEAVEPGDLYLLCSDGLSNALSNATIENILSGFHDSLQIKITDLVSQAKCRDGTDNITGGLIQVPDKWPNGKILAEKYIFNEEPKEVTEYLDQCIKSIFPKTTSVSNRRKKIVALLIILISICFLIGFLLVRADGLATLLIW
jgi:protein phosphatase